MPVFSLSPLYLLVVPTHAFNDHTHSVQRPLSKEIVRRSVASILVDSYGCGSWIPTSLRSYGCGSWIPTSLRKFEMISREAAVTDGLECLRPATKVKVL